MMARLVLSTTLSLMALATAPAMAQGLDDLPDRPIARAEVVAVVKRQVAAMDANRDGVVTEAEFERYRARQPASGSASSGMDALSHVGGHWFEHADADGDGRVTLAEAEARPLKLFGMADTNGDGVVSVQERKVAAMLMSLGGR